MGLDLSGEWSDDEVQVLAAALAALTARSRDAVRFLAGRVGEMADDRSRYAALVGLAVGSAGRAGASEWVASLAGSEASPDLKTYAAWALRGAEPDAAATLVEVAIAAPDCPQVVLAVAVTVLQAAGRWERAWEVAQRLEDESVLSRNAAAWAAVLAGHVDVAVGLLPPSYFGDEAPELAALHTLATVTAIAGDVDGAQRAFDTARAQPRALGVEWAWVQGALADAYGLPEDAAQAWEVSSSHIDPGVRELSRRSLAARDR